MVDLTMTDELTRRNADSIMHERIKAVEVKQDIIYRELKDHVTREDQDRKELIGEIRELRAAQEKQKGFIAGVSAAVSALVIAVGMAIKWLQSGG